MPLLNAIDFPDQIVIIAGSEIFIYEVNSAAEFNNSPVIQFRVTKLVFECYKVSLFYRTDFCQLLSDASDFGRVSFIRGSENKWGKTEWLANLQVKDLLSLPTIFFTKKIKMNNFKIVSLPWS